MSQGLTEDYEKIDSVLSPADGRGGPRVGVSLSVPSHSSSNNSPGASYQINIEDDSSLPPLTIPLGHRCSNDSLLALPQVQLLIGRYPDDFFFRVESQRSCPQIRTFSTVEDDFVFPQVDEETSSSLKDRFSQTIHLVNPFIDEPTYIERYRYGLGSDSMNINQRAVVLLVYALGTIGGERINEDGADDENVPGMQFFNPAFHILTRSWASCLTGDITLAQGLILCSLYFCYIAQPLRAWKVIHMASTTVQQLLITYVSL